MATTEEEFYVYLQGLINEHSPLRHQEGSTDILPYLRELAADAATRVKAEREAYDEYRRLKKDRGILIKARETAQTNMVASAIDDMLKDVSEAVDGHESYIEESKSIGLKSITSRANQHIWAAANQINIQLDTVHNVPRAAYWTAWILHYEGVEGTIVGRNDAIAIYKEYKHHSDDSTPLTRIEKAIIGQIRKHEARAIAGIPLNMESLKLVQDTFVLARAKANNTRSSLGTPLRHVVLGMFYWARETGQLIAFATAMADNKQLRKWLGANINQYLEWLKDKDKDKDKDKEDKENGLIENFFIKQQLEYVISLL